MEEIQNAQWLGHVEVTENDMIAKNVYVEDCAGSCSVGRPWKKWIETVKACLYKKGGLTVKHARSLGYEQLTLTRCSSCCCHEYLKPLKGTSVSAVKPTI